MKEYSVTDSDKCIYLMRNEYNVQVEFFVRMKEKETNLSNI